MTRAFLTSGDLIADRRAQYAEMMFESGDRIPAADLMRQAMDIVPGWVPGWFRLGEMEAEAGDRDAAADAWQRVLLADPEDHFGAGLKMAALGLTTQPEAPPAAYVETLFDAYAPTFEKALLDKLGYRVPGLLDEAIRRHAPISAFRHAIDLGCGTGLMGELLRSKVTYLEGTDLSDAMLQKARDKSLYDKLEQRDVNVQPTETGFADLVVAADVFVYVGDLERAFVNIRQALAIDGLFAFSVEVHNQPGDLLLQQSLRFTHSEPYVRRLLADHGFELLELKREPIRMDRGEPLQGLIVVARRS